MPATVSKMLTPPEAAKRLGVSPQTVIWWIRAGELPAINIGRRSARRPRFRITEDDFERFLEGRRVQPATKPARRRRAARSQSIPDYFDD